MAYIIRFRGQSNLVATGGAMSELQAEYKQIFPSIQVFTGSTFESLDYTQNNNQFPVKADGFGPEFSALKKIQEHLGETIYCIKIAAGGTHLGTTVSPSTNWNAATKGSYFSMSNSVTNAALIYLWNTLNIRSYTLIDVWMQGGSDAMNITEGDAYQANFTAFINADRANLTGSALQSMRKELIVPCSEANADVAASTTITDATNATPIVITTQGGHGKNTGDGVRIFDVLGNTAANGVWVVTRLTSLTFSLNTSVGNGAYTSGGIVDSHPKRLVVIAAQEAVAAAFSGYSFSTASIDSESDGHFTATGIDQVGTMIADIFIDNNL